MGFCPDTGFAQALVLPRHLDEVLPRHLDGVLPRHLDGVLPRHLDEVLHHGILPKH